MEIASQEQLNKLVTEFIETHHSEINEMIEKKVTTAVKRAINDAFSQYGNGIVNKQIEELVEGKISKITTTLDIDTELVTQRLQKKVEQQVKKASIQIKL